MMKAQITAQMSEVDRLSNSGLYPILPIGDRTGRRDDKEREKHRTNDATPAKTKDDEPAPLETPRPPKSLIDEYA